MADASTSAGAGTTPASACASTPGVWSPSSWRAKPVDQMVEYKDPAALEDALAKAKALPPLFSPGETDALRAQLADVAAGKRFLLQGGDCAERFADCNSDAIEQKLKIMLQMSLVLTWGARVPTVRVARMAGQFAKPRSKATELVDGVEYFSFRGDNVNSHDLSQRDPDPQRLIDGYFHSSATLNYARSLIKEGFCDLRCSTNWELGFVKSPLHRGKYEKMVSTILDSLAFADICGLADESRLKTIDLFTCHEGLHLPYEEALTRKKGDKYYNVGAPFIWIGDRTRHPDHAHVEYFRGIENPIGLKVGPSMKVEDLVPLILKLCPDIKEQPGKVTLISRFGAGNVAKFLPPLIRVVKAAALPVIWCCDPMHGNTTTSSSGLKTRSFDDVLSELTQSFSLHTGEGSKLGGVHFEMTGENCTECTGGPEELRDDDLPLRYTTYCDPRLNYAQSLEMAFIIAGALGDANDATGAGAGTEKPTDGAAKRQRVA